MLGNLLSIFTGDIPQEPLSEMDRKLALAALLVRVARSDQDYAAQEITVIDAVLMREYGLDQDEATALRQEAEAFEAKAPDTVRFTRVLKEAVPFEERSAILEALWEVVLADDDRHFEEEGFMRLVANLVGVNDRDNALARQRVIARRDAKA